jgi:hypothetical protein
MLSLDEINKLGNIIDTTFGRYSSPTGHTSVTAHLTGDVLAVKFVTVIVIASEMPAHLQVDGHRQPAQKAIDGFMKRVRDEFKEETGRALKVKNLKYDDSVEVISASPYVLKRNAFFRMNASFQVS